jgi:hypothetical protein
VFLTIRTSGAARSGYKEPEPGQETPGSIITWNHLASSLNREGDSVTCNDCPYREGRVPEGVGFVSQDDFLMDTLR